MLVTKGSSKNVFLVALLLVTKVSSKNVNFVALMLVTKGSSKNVFLVALLFCFVAQFLVAAAGCYFSETFDDLEQR